MQRPFLPGEKVEYRHFADLPALRGTVEMILACGLIRVRLDTGAKLDIDWHFLTHIND